MALRANQRQQGCMVGAEWDHDQGLGICTGRFPVLRSQHQLQTLLQFLFSSTWFYVKQTFWWWKNRLEQCLCIYAAMILHNLCVVNGENELQNWRLLLGQTQTETCATLN